MRIVILLIIAILSTPAIAEKQFWTNGTAETLPKGTFEIGLFNSLKYGLTDNVQLETHPINMFYAPNFRVTSKWLKNEHVMLSTLHKLHYPTLLLNMVSKEGIGGLLPTTTEFPHFALIDNAVSGTFGQDFTLTTTVGFIFSIGEIDESITTIDYPLIYPRLNAYYNRYSGYFSTVSNYEVGAFDFEVGVKFFALAQEVGVDLSHIEQKSIVSYQLNSTVLFDLGYNMTTGKYPYGRDFKIFPLGDVRFQF